MDIKPLSQIRTRRDFTEAFHEAMSGAHESLRRRWTFEKEQNLPKSYLVEFHPKSDESHSNGWTSESVFSALKKAGKLYNARVNKTDDESLFFLAHFEQHHKAEFIVDCLNPRFLAFHTISNASSTDRFIFDRLTQYQPEFDLFWFPVSLLEAVERRERITGWEAQFDPLIDGRGFLPPEGQEDSTSNADEEQIDSGQDEIKPPMKVIDRPRLDMRFEHPDALKTYAQLKKSVPDLLPDIPLNAVLTERSDEQVQTYARAFIKSYGKITGRGPDFYAYLQIVNGTLDNYAEVVQNLEDQYWIRLLPCNNESSEGFRISGKPFGINFEHRMNPQALIQAMFDCKRPFRLMGTIEQIDEDYFSVDAMDLHVNQRVSFEIAPEFMRIYLYEGTCANTLVRILRSLQHHIDSKLRHPQLLGN